MWVGGQRHATATLPTEKSPVTHFVGGWVGHRLSVNVRGKSRTHRGSNPGP